MHRRIAVECSRFSERIGGHDYFVQEGGRFDVVVPNQWRLATVFGVHARSVAPAVPAKLLSKLSRLTSNAP